jgi:branched-chain amino acid transport system ATP-binding protein
MALLTVNNITKNFGGIKALNDVSLSINEKEILGLIGPNGSGKTTLVNVVTGVYLPDSGEITYKGVNITKIPPYQRCRMGIARTYQVVRLFNNLTVLENTLIGVLNGQMYGKLSTTKAEGIAENILEMVRLSELKDSPCKLLNAQQRRRVELARALGASPELLILDECLAGLTPLEVEEMLGVIREIRDEKGIAIIMIEHLMHAVMNISDRVAVLHEGRKIAEGKPENIVKDEEVIEVYLGDRELALKFVRK